MITEGFLSVFYTKLCCGYSESPRLGNFNEYPQHISRAMRKCVMSYASNKGTDQPAHPRSLISAFIVHCLDSIISLDSIAEISRL